MIKEQLELQNDKKLNDLMVLRWDLFARENEAMQVKDWAGFNRFHRLYTYTDWHIGILQYLGELCEGMK